MNKKIGIFDSGMGGVSVLHEAGRRLKGIEFIFYADTDHVPYGVRSAEEIKGFADDIVRNLVDRGSDAIVIACNTATAVAADYLRDKYDLPIIGMEPAVKPAVEELLSDRSVDASEDNVSRVLVMATPVTIRENKLRKLLDKVDRSHLVDLLPMPELVTFAENGIFEGEKVDSYIEDRLSGLSKKAYSEVVLGCTHFNYFKPAIASAFGHEIKLIDGNQGTVKHLAEVLDLKLSDVGVSEGDSFDRKSLDNKVTYLLSGREASEEDMERFEKYHKRLDDIDTI